MLADYKFKITRVNGLKAERDLLVSDLFFISEFHEYLRRSQDVFFAVFGNAFQIVFFPINGAYHAAIDVFFWGGYVKDGTEQFDGGIVLVVAKFP